MNLSLVHTLKGGNWHGYCGIDCLGLFNLTRIALEFSMILFCKEDAHTFQVGGQVWEGGLYMLFAEQYGWTERVVVEPLGIN